MLRGLYALGGGVTCVSFHRALFPLFVGAWFTRGVPAGLSARGAVALLLASNYAGGIAGGAAAFALNRYPRKGRLVVFATAAYGMGCLGFGSTRQVVAAAAAAATIIAAAAAAATTIAAAML